MTLTEAVTDNSSIKICLNKIEKKITFKTKTEYYLKKMKLLGSSKSKVNKEKKGEHMSHLETTELVLIHCNIVSNDYQQDSRVWYTSDPSKSFVQLLDISPKTFVFLNTFIQNFHTLKYGLLIKILNS